MDREKIMRLLQEVASGALGVEEATSRLHGLPYQDLGFARLDHHRSLRHGFPEVVFCPGKTPEQVAILVARLAAAHGTVLATRAQPEVFATVKALVPDAEYHERARVIAVRREASRCIGQAAVITAGTSDIPVAEEAAVCLETMGARVERIYDVGVAGLHRLFDSLELMERMQVLVVVAGMEGALASVVGGLTSRPVIAVPTSVGYGANFGGLAALLSMLNTCAPGVGVVNIDNGFGAAALAAAILRSVPAGAAPATGEDLQAASEK